MAPPKAPPPSKWPSQYKIPYEVQQRLEVLLGPALVRSHENPSENPSEEAMKEALAAFLETPQGKRLKEVLLSRRVLPATLIVVGTGVVGIIANDGDIPALPDREIGGITVKVDFLGKFDDPKGIRITLSFPLGGDDKPKRRKRPVGTPLPADLQTQIERQIDKNVLRNWIVKQVTWEYETAGPDEEDRKRPLYRRVKNDRDSTPDAQEVAKALAAEFIKANRQQLKRIDFHLYYEDIWDGIVDISGVAEPLQKLVGVVAGLMPKEAAGINSVGFYCGKRVIPILVK